jgi:hypothetical protein
MLKPIHTLLNLNKDTGKSDSAKLLKYRKKKNLNAQPLVIAAAGVDLPYNGGGPHDEAFSKIDFTTEWLRQIIMFIRNQGPDVPLVVIARSASPALIAELNFRYPGLIDGLVFSGPSYPDLADLKASDVAIEEIFQSGVTKKNAKAYEWSDVILPQTKWAKSETPIGNIPFLIEIGGLDAQISPSEKAKWENIVAKTPGAKLRVYPHYAHDTFSMSKDENTNNQVKDLQRKLVELKEQLKSATKDPATPTAVRKKINADIIATQSQIDALEKSNDDAIYSPWSDVLDLLNDVLAKKKP